MRVGTVVFDGGESSAVVAGDRQLLLHHGRVKEEVRLRENQ
jgi:hypothetical protein